MALTTKQQERKERVEARVAQMPALEGTEPQVEWAADIRQQIVARDEREGEAEKLLSFARERRPEMVEQVQDGLERLWAESSASWWIEHRRESLHDLVAAQMGY